MKPLHWSQLKVMSRSDAHYKQALTEERVATPAMIFGTAVHYYCIGGRGFVMYEGKARTGKAWKEFKAENEGCDILLMNEAAQAAACAAAVKANPVAFEVLCGGVWEEPIEWEISGRACAGTPDVAGHTLADLKTTTSAEPFKFMRHADKMGYCGQLAWYFEGLQQNGVAPKRVSIIAVETKPPYVSTVFDLTKSAMEAGTAMWRGLFERLMVCERSDMWPGYTQSPVPFDAENDVTITVDGEEIEL